MLYQLEWLHSPSNRRNHAYTTLLRVEILFCTGLKSDAGGDRKGDAHSLGALGECITFDGKPA